ncbi:MAG: primosomal protein N', partial [Phaeodactylibacter sp.]|nr:primosomal protein N' [Phaeodactylibacter sp.]
LQTNHPVLREVIRNDFDRFYSREITERQSFSYPPYVRLIKLTLKHKRPEILNSGARFLAPQLKAKLGQRVIGPAIPYISRVRGFYLIDFLIKLERNKNLLEQTKEYLTESIGLLHKEKGCSGIRVNVDVDPY